MKTTIAKIQVVRECKPLLKNKLHSKDGTGEVNKVICCALRTDGHQKGNLWVSRDTVNTPVRKVFYLVEPT